MSAYATARSGRPPLHVPLDLPDTSPAAPTASDLQQRFEVNAADAFPVPGGPIDGVIGHIAERIAAAVVAQLARAAPGNQDEWLDSRRAAEYLGVHRDTLRKLAAERAIPAEQDGPGCKLFFRRPDLDEWRRQGGRDAQLSAVLDRAA